MCSTSRHGMGGKDEVQTQQTNLQNTKTRRSGVLTIMDRPPGMLFEKTITPKICCFS